MTKMKRIAVLSLLFFCGLQIYSCASVDRSDPAAAPPASKVGSDQASPSLGQFIMGKAPAKAGNEVKDERKERKDDKKDGGKRDEYKTRNDKPPGPMSNHINPPSCPPCPCVPQASQPSQVPNPWAGGRPRENDDKNRPKRSTNDDYWFSTGSPNSLLSQINMGYQAQNQMRDFLSKYGPPLHVGTINQADFNYPQDFHAFNQPAISFTDITDNVIYELRGPLEVSPVGALVGPFAGGSDAFSTMLKTGGLFKLLGVQKDGLLKLVDENNAVFNVDCNRQRYGGCQNLVQVQNAWTVPKFTPVVSKTYVLTGFLDVTLTDVFSATPPTTLQTGVYVIEAVTTVDKFRMKDVSSSKVYFVDCQRQRLPKTCENLRAL